MSKIEIERRLKGGFVRNEAERVNWLQEFIPKTFPTSHPALFGHNADWFFMAPFKTSEESANNLLRDLKEARKDIKVSSLSLLTFSYYISHLLVRPPNNFHRA